MSDRHESSLREIDCWLRRMAIIGPIVAFILGWGTGILTAAVLYRDHEKRIQALEDFRKDQITIHTAIAETIAAIKEHLRLK
jgi:hypothetical protein